MAPTNRAVIVTCVGTASVQPAPYPRIPADSGVRPTTVTRADVGAGIDGPYVIVRSTAYSLNPADWKHRDEEDDGEDGFEGCEGCVVGADFAGVVVEVGQGVKTVKKGDRVAGLVNGCCTLRKSEGAFADFVLAKSETLMKIPDNVSDAEAASMGVALATSALALYQHLGLPKPNSLSKPKSTIFIYGGSTGTALVGIQLAKLSGAVVVTTASPHNADYLRSLGADHVLDYKSPTLADDVLRLNGGKPLLYAWDCHSDEDSGRVCARVLTRNASAGYVALLFEGREAFQEVNPEAKTMVAEAYAVTGEKWVWEGVKGPEPKAYYLLQELMPFAGEALAKGLMKPPRVFLNREGTGLEGILKGLDLLAAGKVSGGKLVYTA